MILAGNEDMYTSLEAFEFRSDLTSGYGVTLERLKTDVSTFLRLLSIRSILDIKITRTCIISRMSSNFGQNSPGEIMTMVATFFEDLPC